MFTGPEFSCHSYWMAVSITSVGYGYVTPITTRGTLFFICFVLLGLSIVSFSISVFIDTVGELLNMDRVQPVPNLAEFACLAIASRLNTEHILAQAMEQYLFGWTDRTIGVPARVAL